MAISAAPCPCAVFEASYYTSAEYVCSERRTQRKTAAISAVRGIPVEEKLLDDVPPRHKHHTDNITVGHGQRRGITLHTMFSISLSHYSTGPIYNLREVYA